MISDAALAFLSERHLGVLSTIGRDGRTHAVPVGFTYDEGIARVIGSRGTQKFRNVERTGRASITSVDGRRWLSLEGPARMLDDADSVDLAVALYTERYQSPRANPQRVVLELSVERVMSSSGLKS